ncbi:hypothetical protein [Brucella sp. 2280]|uniref:hypothetical protein n=1 Tax=Brucella sp. 2280 TaxID=2592625 RepID=UPI001FFF8D03|nr:hypothetical protein [Brucella sp. 2280]
MAKTTNYQWDLPNPYGDSQIIEMTKTASAFDGVDSKIKAFEDSYLAHEHAFGELTGRPTTLAGYGISDGMTADEVADAIRQAVDGLVNGSGTALDTLKELADALGNDPNFAGTVSTALGFRLRVDAAQPFTLAQKAQGRSNLDALGTADKGQANGVASLDSTGKVPSGQLPALTTTATVGAAMAGANSKETPDDGDFLGGVLAGGSTMFKTTWGNIKAALQAFFDGRYLKLVGGTIQGILTVSGEGSQRGVFRNTGDGDSWINFHTRDQNWYSEFGQRANGAAYAWVNGQEFRFQTDGSFLAPGASYSGGAVYAANGNATLHIDGNVEGSIWAGWGSRYAFQAINAQIEKRANDYANDRAYAHAIQQVRELCYAGRLSLMRIRPGMQFNPNDVINGADLAYASLTVGGSNNDRVTIQSTFSADGAWRLLGHTNVNPYPQGNYGNLVLCAKVI